MACRVGMTTDPEERKRYWKSKYPNLYDWDILGHYSSKSEAQAAETQFASEYKCISFPGGDGPESADWTVYRFKYHVMQYRPDFSNAKVVKKIPFIEGKYTAFLLDEIESVGRISYRFILDIVDHQTLEPCFSVASEVQGIYGEVPRMLGIVDKAETEGTVEYVLGAFPGEGHLNYGASKDWGDIAKFEQAALKVAEEFFHENGGYLS